MHSPWVYPEHISQPEGLQEYEEIVLCGAAQPGRDALATFLAANAAACNPRFTPGVICCHRIRGLGQNMSIKIELCTRNICKPTNSLK